MVRKASVGPMAAANAAVSSMTMPLSTIELIAVQKEHSHHLAVAGADFSQSAIGRHRVVELNDF